MTPQVVIAGGGTGGHLFPGLAVAEELRERGAGVTFIGTARGIEARAVPRAGFPVLFIDVAGLKGKGALGGMRNALRLPGSALQTVRLLRRLRPQVVIGVGGYASGPVVMLAALLGIPTVVLEQNSVPGVTNRILGRVCRGVFIAFPAAASFFPARKVQCLGNPIRRSLLERAGAGSAPGPAASVPPRARVLVLGGSQGARAVNELFTGAVQHLLPLGKSRLPLIRHQTGPADAEEVQARYRGLGLAPGEARVDPFIEDMGAAYAAADLVVGRAGATTLAEITALGLPSILIPFPFAADDHQTQNARWLESQGAARVLVQAQASPAELGDLLHALCDDQAARRRMAERSRALGRPGAAAAVATGVLDLVASG